MTRRAILALILVVILTAPAVVITIAHRDARHYSGLAVGQVVPDAQLSDLHGNPVETRSWRGSPTLLVLYLSKCQACKREIEGLRTISGEFPALKITLLSLDSAPPVVQTEFPVLVDPSGRFLKMARRLTAPTLYLLRSDGRLVWARSGQRPPEEERATLSTLLGSTEQESRD